ncbi:MAG: hypothetical protein ABR538_05385 [Candidatus Binatia bacterium]
MTTLDGFIDCVDTAADVAVDELICIQFPGYPCPVEVPPTTTTSTTLVTPTSTTTTADDAEGPAQVSQHARRRRAAGSKIARRLTFRTVDEHETVAGSVRPFDLRLRPARLALGAEANCPPHCSFGAPGAAPDFPEAVMEAAEFPTNGDGRAAERAGVATRRRFRKQPAWHD